MTRRGLHCRVEDGSEWIRRYDGEVVRVTGVNNRGVHYHTLYTLVAYVRPKVFFLKHFRPQVEGAHLGGRSA